MKIARHAFAGLCLRGALLAACAPVVALANPSAGSASDPARDVLPLPQPPSQAVIGPDLARSVQDFPALPTAPRQAPNVIVVLTDDVGFGAASAFGGPIPTPHLERLAQSGVTYNRFHSTAMCSPTRASLLTGRNAHAIGTGAITDFATGFPGYTGIIPDSAATVADILGGNGYSTAMFGKHHNVPTGQRSPAGPFGQWPLGLGFDHFFGFISSGTDQFHPVIYRDNTRIIEDPGQDILDKRFADEAIRWLHNQKAAAPERPFFLYLATGSAHAPLQAPREWIDRFKGQFDQGWDALRAETLARQKRLGLVPKNTRLAAMQKDIPAWDSLSADERRVHARFMEVYAGMLAYQDEQFGRLLGEVERMGLRDNTLIIFIEGDNGSDSNGTPAGRTSEAGEVSNRASTFAEKLAAIDDLGGPRAEALAATGWAQALDAPFPYYKQVASHLGGTRQGMVVSWPAGISGRGIRSQFHHVIDIMPTILEAARIPAPVRVNGVDQQPVDGISMAYSFNDASAPDRRRTQYFEMLGNRAIYHDGWLASTTPLRRPWEMVTGPGAGDNLAASYTWELYDLRKDFSQSTDIAARHPGKLKEMQTIFEAEARRHGVFPLDDRTSFGRMAPMKARYAPDRDHYVFWGKDISLARDVMPPMFNRGFTLTADLRPAPGQQGGVIAAVGSWFGGWSFHLKDGKPAVSHAFSQFPGDQTTVTAPDPLVPGQAARVQYAFAYDGGGAGKGGTVTISVDGRDVARGRIERSIVTPAGTDETFDVGRDTGVPVGKIMPDSGAFAGAIDKVEVRLGAILQKGDPSGN